MGPPQARDPRRGFTLIELMVTLAVIALVAAVALPKALHTDGAAASEGAARQIHALAQQARYTALASGKQVQLTLREQNPVAQVRVAQVTGNQPLTAADFGPVADSLDLGNYASLLGILDGASTTTSAPAGDTATHTLVFYPAGSAQLQEDGASGATIFVADKQGEHPYRILIYATGFAKVLDR